MDCHQNGNKGKKNCQGRNDGESGLRSGREALQFAKVKAEEIDLILVATCSPDTFFPSTACQVQAALGAKNAAAFDMSAACAGFLFGLNTAYATLTVGFIKKCYLSEQTL